jgi:DNA-binding CsgD family transcriptional regulator
MNEDELGGWVGWPDVDLSLESTAGGSVGRAFAIACDAEHGSAFELAKLWERLSSGKWQVREAFSGDDRLYAVVEEPVFRPHRRRRRRGLAMMERVLLGESAKVVAIESKVTESTVAVAIKGQLRSMGLDCKVRATPLILVMAARAARSPRCRALSAKIARLQGDAATKWVIGVGYPSLGAFDGLSNAERTVLLQLLDGKTYLEIAEQRGASKRTIANQLGAAFRKLGVSGYGQVLDRLMTSALGTRGLDAPGERRLELKSALAP